MQSKLSSFFNHTFSIRLGICFAPLMVFPQSSVSSILSETVILLKIYVSCHIITKAFYITAQILFISIWLFLISQPLTLTFSHEKVRLDDKCSSPAYTDDLKKYVFYILSQSCLLLFLTFIYQNLDKPVELPDYTSYNCTIHWLTVSFLKVAQNCLYQKSFHQKRWQEVELSGFGLNNIFVFIWTFCCC